MTQSTEVCEQGLRQRGQPQRLLTLRESCLENRLGQLHIFAEVLGRGSDQPLLSRAVQAAQEFPLLADCADTQALAAAVPLPEQPAVREKVQALQHQVDQLSVLLRLGKYKEGQ